MRKAERRSTQVSGEQAHRPGGRQATRGALTAAGQLLCAGRLLRSMHDPIPK